MSDIPTSPPPTGGPEPAGLDTAISSLFGEAPAIGTSNPYANSTRLLEVFRECKREALDSRWVFERTWWRNLLYVLGRQWIYYDRKRGQWLDKRMAKWIPRPVTNKCKEGVESLVSLFQGIMLNLLARPVGNASPNVAAAEVADGIYPYVADEHQLSSVTPWHDFWLIVTGNAFLHTYWDKSAEHGIVSLPFQRCQACGTVSPPAHVATGMCPACGSPMMEPAMQADGAPMVQSAPVGQGRTEPLSPFEVCIPPIYTKLDDAPFLVRLRFRPKRYYDDYLPEIAKKVAFEKSPTERSLQYLRSLAAQTDLSSLPAGFGWGSGQELDQQGTTEYELWKRPNKEFPEGLFLRVAGDEILVVDDAEQTPGPLPYQTQQNQPVMPFVHTPYMPIGGRLWASSPLDLVIQKQDQINQLDSLTQLIVQRMANPIWLKPKGSEVKSFSGEPGIVVEYNPLAAGNAKPERIPGEEIPTTLFQLRQQYLQDFEILMGTFDVIKGAKPTGVEAFSALQLLVERGQSRFATVFKARGEAHRRWYTLALELERQFGPDERVLSATKPNIGWTFYHFQRAKLQGAIAIVVEDGSQAPKTNLGRRAAIEQLNQLGMIDRADPEQRYTIYRDYGVSNLLPSLDFDVKSALTEQDSFERWVQDGQFDEQQMAYAVQQHQAQLARYQQVAGLAQTAGMPVPPPPTLPSMTPFTHKPYHRAQVHYAEHRKWANTDVARQIFMQHPVLEALFIAHLQETQQAVQAEMMGAAPPPGPPPAGRALAMERSNSESGNPRDVPRGTEEGSQGQGPQ